MTAIQCVRSNPGYHRALGGEHRFQGQITFVKIIIVKNSPNTGIALGFAMVLLLMLALVFVGLTRMTTIYWHLKQIVNVQSVKSEHAQVMKNALRERAVLMHSISVLTDSFAQDDEYMKFNDEGTLYVMARRELEGMTLSDEEKTILAQIRVRTLPTQPLVTQVVETALAGHLTEAQALIRDKVMPAQTAIALELDKLIQLEQTETQLATAQAEGTYGNARLWLLGLGAAAIGLGLMIAFLVIRNTNRQTNSLQHQAMFDGLTNLPNRALFSDRIQQAVLISRREKQSFAIIAVDLDRFKEINDALGHAVGDQVLQQVAERARGCLRESDTFARMGGDEFTVLLPTTMNLDGAMVLAKKILSAVSKPMVIGGKNLEVRASLGVALFPEHGAAADVLLRNADAAMYEAKRTQGGFKVYDVDLDQHVGDQVTLQSELHYAIDNDELLLHYQPKIDFDSGRVSGVEALVRWQHPKRGLLFPDTFILLAEKTGLIKALTLDVLRKALRQSDLWYQSGLDLTVAVNISSISIQDPGFPDQLAELLKSVKVPASKLELEITETAVMTGIVQAVDCIKRLNALGLQIAIDDFGTGYSSMTHLRDLLVAKIKIDKSFVKDMAVNHNDAMIVRSTVELGHSLGMKVIAEGVEGQPAWDQLKSLGCDSAQGYYMSRPVTAEKFLEWLQESQWGLPSDLEVARNL